MLQGFTKGFTKFQGFQTLKGGSTCKGQILAQINPDALFTRLLESP